MTHNDYLVSYYDNADPLDKGCVQVFRSWKYLELTLSTATDIAVDFVQEHVLHQGSQKNESVLEQLKDEGISDTIRKQYKNITGKEFPIEDK